LTDAFRLDGRVAFVTGAGGGLGEGICTSLAAAGAAVACADVDPDRAEAVARRVADGGGSSLALQVDVTDSAAVEAMVHEVQHVVQQGQSVLDREQPRRGYAQRGRRHRRRIG